MAKLASINFRFRYAIAMTFFLLLSLGAFLSVSQVINSNKSNAPLVNVSGRQRMLSQRITKYSILYDRSKTTQKKKENHKFLAESIDLMESSHVALTRGNAQMNLPKTKSKKVEQMYFGQDMDLDYQVRDFINKARKVESGTYTDYDIDNMVEVSHGRLLESLNAMVKQYELEGTAVIQRLFLMEKVIFGLTLLTILFEVFVIFLPTERKLKAYQIEKENSISTLEAFSEDLENMAFACSHSLKEPTRALLIYLSMLRHRLDEQNIVDNDTHEYLGIVEDEANRVIQSITSLRDYLLITRDDADIYEVDLNKLIDEIIVSLNMNQDSIKLSPLPKIYTKPNLIEKIFYEILKNAREFAKDSGPDIEVSYRKDSIFHVFNIKDYGIGIEKRFLDNVLKPFSKLDPERIYEGTGIGLAMIKRIVNFLGGDMKIDSEFGEYTEVEFTLPA